MTYLEVIKEAESFTDEQKQQLAYFMLLSILNKEKRDNLIRLFDNSADFDFQKAEQELLKIENKPLDNFFKSKGILKNIDT